MGENISTRVAYGLALEEFGDRDNVYVFDADLKSCTMTQYFSEKYPERFFNIGIAEANMVDIAAGFATCGAVSLVHTFAVFAAGRQWKELLPKAEIIPISALSNFNIDYVKRRVEELMPDSPPYFEKDALTDKPARFFVTEIIREKILLYYQKEIPYAVEVVVELFKEDDELIHIKALIIVERDTQKGINPNSRGMPVSISSTKDSASMLY